MHLQNLRYQWRETEIKREDVRKRYILCLMLPVLKMLLDFGACTYFQQQIPIYSFLPS